MTVVATGARIAWYPPADLAEQVALDAAERSAGELRWLANQPVVCDPHRWYADLVYQADVRQQGQDRKAAADSAEAALPALRRARDLARLRAALDDLLSEIGGDTWDAGRKRNVIEGAIVHQAGVAFNRDVDGLITWFAAYISRQPRDDQRYAASVVRRFVMTLAHEWAGGRSMVARLLDRFDQAVQQEVAA